MSKGFVAATIDGAIFDIRVSPGAGLTSIDGEDALKLTGAAPPVDGRAGAVAQRYLAELLGVARSILVLGAEAEDVRGVFSGHLQ